MRRNIKGEKLSRKGNVLPKDRQDKPKTDLKKFMETPMDLSNIPSSRGYGSVVDEKAKMMARTGKNQCDAVVAGTGNRCMRPAKKGEAFCFSHLPKQIPAKKSKRRPTKRKLPTKWKEQSRRFLPETVVIHEKAPGPCTYTYAQSQHEVIETRLDETGMREIRQRRVTSKPLYVHEHPELWLAFKIAIPALRDIEGAIWRNEHPEEFDDDEGPFLVVGHCTFGPGAIKKSCRSLQEAQDVIGGDTHMHSIVVMQPDGSPKVVQAHEKRET